MKFKCHQKYLSHKEGCKKAGIIEADNRPTEAQSSITNASSPSKESLSTLESAPNTNLLNLVSNKELFVTTERAPNVSLLPDLSLSRESLPTAKSAPYTDVLEDLPSSKESLTCTRSAPNIELLPDLSESQEFLSTFDTPFNDQDNMASVVETSNPPIEAPNTDTISSKGIHFERECNVVLDDVLEIKAKKKGAKSCRVTSVTHVAWFLYPIEVSRCIDVDIQNVSTTHFNVMFVPGLLRMIRVSVNTRRGIIADQHH